MTYLPKATSALAALTLAFGLAGCSNEPAGDTTAPKPDATAPAADPGPAVVPSPTPSLPDAGGSTKVEPTAPADAPKGDATPAPADAPKGDAAAPADAPKLEGPKEEGPK